MRCIVCNSEAKIKYEALSDRVHTDIAGEYTLKECQVCKLLFVDPIPNPDELMRHYPEDYHVYTRKPKQISQNKSAVIKLVAKVFFEGKKINALVKFLLLPLYFKLIHLPDSRRNGRLLDVGCGAGTRLPVFELLGWQAEGIEMSKAAATVACEAGYKVTNAELESYLGGVSYYDAIYLNNVFEHFTNPVLALENIGRMLKPKGQLVLVVPNQNSLTYKLFKKHWFALEVPRHIFTYNQYNLSKLLEDHGYEVTKLNYCYNLGSLSSSLANSLNLASNRFSFLAKLTWFLALILDPLMNKLGTGDWMVIHAKFMKHDQ